MEPHGYSGSSSLGRPLYPPSSAPCPGCVPQEIIHLCDSLNSCWPGGRMANFYSIKMQIKSLYCNEPVLGEESEQKQEDGRFVSVSLPGGRPPQACCHRQPLSPIKKLTQGGSTPGLTGVWVPSPWPFALLGVSPAPGAGSQAQPLGPPRLAPRRWSTLSLACLCSWAGKGPSGCLERVGAGRDRGE